MTEEPWVLSRELDRKVGETTYWRYRISVPKRNHDSLSQKLGLQQKIYFTARIQQGKVTLLKVSPPEPKASPEKVEDRAKRVKKFLIKSGGETTWPKVRDFLGLPANSSPGPRLVQELKKLDIESVTNPKTSTKIWRLKTDNPEHPARKLIEFASPQTV
jgi:hypothetical protein